MCAEQGELLLCARIPRRAFPVIAGKQHVERMVLNQKQFVLRLLDCHGNDLIDAFQRGKNSHPVPGAVHRAFSFHLRHIVVLTDSDNQVLAQSLAPLQQIQMSHMKQVEHPDRDAGLVFLRHRFLLSSKIFRQALRAPHG